MTSFYKQRIIKIFKNLANPPGIGKQNGGEFASTGLCIKHNIYCSELRCKQLIICNVTFHATVFMKCEPFLIKCEKCFILQRRQKL